MRQRVAGPPSRNSPLAVRLARVRRLAGRVLLGFGIWAAVILAVVAAGFIGQRVGIWASVLWGVLLIGGLVVHLRRRSQQPADS
jgi:hypothetical protein